MEDFPEKIPFYLEEKKNGKGKGGKYVFGEGKYVSVEEKKSKYKKNTILAHILSRQAL